MTRTRRLPHAFALLLAAAGALLAGQAGADAPAGDAAVPDCVGLDAAAAQRMSRQAGFETQLAYGASGQAGRVVSQDPGGLAVRPVGGTVRLTVAGPEPAAPRTPEPAPEPAPARPPEPIAPPELPPAEPTPPLPPPETTPPPEEPTPPVAPPPEPAPEEPPPAPSAIDVMTLVVEPPPNTSGPALPNALGKPAEQARQELRQWNAVIELILTDAASNGRVVEQMPRPTSNLAAGETVTLLVGTTNVPRDHRQVPALVDLSADEAVAALKKAGFEPVLRATPSTPAQRGRVLRQAPQRYTFAAPGLGVKVVVGRGDQPVPEPAPVPPTPAPSDVPPGGTTPPVAPEPVAPEPPVTPEPPPATPAAPPKPAPGPVTLVGPTDSENYPRAHGATFEWRTVVNADAYEWELQIQSGNTWRTAQTEKLIGTKFRPARLEAGRYRWRVRALSGETPGAWSDYRLLYLY